MPNYSGIWTEQAVMQAVGAGNWANVPGVPTGVTGTVLGATSVSVAFTAPTFAGIPATITSYTVTSSPGGITASGASSPITVTGLTTGTPYTFTVTATNASGTSSPSAASSSVTPVQIDYIEDVFSTYLYTGNGSTQTITNGIDLSTKGGLVWLKYRTDGGANHIWTDTVRGATKSLYSNATDAQATVTQHVTGFTTSGFSVGNNGNVNNSGGTFASWTFRKQPKFFDVVTYTGTGSLRTVSHSLGSVPGCIIIKNLSDTDGWLVYHRSIGATKTLSLNTTGAAVTDGNTYFNDTEPTSTQFTVNIGGKGNQSGNNYVAYLFAHDAGGFGLSGSDNVISCGSFTTDSGGNATVSLGYEPAWVMFKCSSNAGQNWEMIDTMRGWSMSTDVSLQANSAAAEASGGFGNPTATGFVMGGQGNTQTYIYIAIRRGPMKVPTDGTSVFLPKTRTGNGTAGTVVTGASWPMDALWISRRTGGGAGVGGFTDIDRLRGAYLGGNNPLLRQNQSDAESTTYVAPGFVGGQTSYDLPSGSGYGLFNTNAVTYIDYLFRRSPSVFDEVCYTGTNSGGSSQTISHNLGVAPELTIFKKRAAVSNWTVAMPAIGGNAVSLNLNDVGASSNIQFIDTYGASSITTASGYDTISENTTTYVAYFFATCAGVSKVGSYTGTGALLTVNCGFAAGARFVLIKRTDSTGDWYTYDSARGISSSSDPYLFLNSTAAEVTGTNYVDTTSVGFQVTAAAPAGLNASGGTYIFLAIA